MERDIKSTGLTNLITLLLVGLAAAFAAEIAGSASGKTAAIFFMLGFLVAVVSYFQMRLEAKEQAEKLEFEELSKSRRSTTLFESEAGEAFPAQRARAQFERVFVPVFTVALLLLQGAGVWWVFKLLKEPPVPNAERSLVFMGIYAVFFLVLFLLGKFSAGLARIENRRLLRPGASYMLLGAFLCGVVAVGEAAVRMQAPQVDAWLAYAQMGLLALIGVETLVHLVFEIYRPRVEGKAARVLYESRLVGLLGQPGGLITTAAEALDYQFGFKVSQTWFYRFLERAFAWIVLVQLGALLLSTMIVVVDLNELVLIERFGKPAGEDGVLKPGLHLKFPWPMERVYRYDVGKLLTVNVGDAHDNEDGGGDDGHGHEDPGARPNPLDNVILWTTPHEDEEEFNLLVASREQVEVGNPDQTTPGDAAKAVPVNLLTVSVPVHFRINDVRAWAYNHVDPALTLEKIATREVVRYLVSVDIHEIMTVGRHQAARDLRSRIQDQAKQVGLGAEILFVGLQDVHPPTSVADAYEGVNKADQEAAAKQLMADGYLLSEVPRARAEAARVVSYAEILRNQATNSASAMASRFTNQIAAYHASPEVYVSRTYLETLTRAIKDSRKYVLLSTNNHEVFQIDLEDKVRMDLTDVKLSDPAQKSKQANP